MKFIDRTGQTFGRLTVLKFAGKQANGRIRWLCRCSCGIEKLFVGHNLFNGDSKSCGCLKLELRSKPIGVAAKNRIKKTYRNNARKRGLEWKVSDVRFDALIAGNCFYCGAAPGMHYKDTRYPIPCNGIDRRDNTKGYTDANTVSCCPQCNWAKNDLTFDEFILWIQGLARTLFSVKEKVA